MDDPQQPIRQQAYLRALSTTGVEVHYGQFRHDRRRMRRSRACVHSTTCSDGSTIEVLYTEEKGSDVNLASYLLRDAALGDCALAIVITNDTDLVEPIRIVHWEFGCQDRAAVTSRAPVEDAAERRR